MVLNIDLPAGLEILQNETGKECSYCGKFKEYTVKREGREYVLSHSRFRKIGNYLCIECIRNAKTNYGKAVKQISEKLSQTSKSI